MTREECLKKAQECVCGQREQDYGTPESNFGLIADLWNAYLINGHQTDQMKLYDGATKIVSYDKRLTPTDVAMMMALLKIARIKNGGGTGDSFVDLAGYAACGAEIFGTKDKEVEPKTERLCYSSVTDTYYSSPIDDEDIVNRKAHCKYYSYLKMGCSCPSRSDCIIGSEKLREDGKVAIVTNCPNYEGC